MKKISFGLLLFYVLVFSLLLVSCETITAPGSQNTISVQATITRTKKVIHTSLPTIDRNAPTDTPLPTPTIVTHPEWTTYSTGLNNINAMQFDQEGYLWAAVEHEGVVKWDVQKSTYIHYTREDGLLTNCVSAIAMASDGSLWFANYPDGYNSDTGGAIGLSKYDGHSWKTYSSRTYQGLPNYVRSMAVDQSGVLWIAYGFQGVIKFDGNTATELIDPSGKGMLKTSNLVAIAPNGDIWYGGYYGIVKYDGESFSAFDEVFGLADDFFTALAVAPDGVVWASTFRGELFKYDGTNWARDTSENAPRGGENFAIAPNGDVWVDLSRFRDGKWSRYDWGNGIDPPMYKVQIAGPDGSTWFGTYGDGILRFDGKETTFFLADAPMGSQSAYIAISPDGRTVWRTALTLGIDKFENGHWTHLIGDLGIMAHNIYTAAPAPNGSMWFSSWQDGALIYDGKSWRVLKYDNAGYFGGMDLLGFSQNGTAWFGAGHGGLRSVLGTVWSRYDFPAPMFFKEDFNIVTCMATGPDGSLWFGTRAGLAKNENNKWTYFDREQTSVTTIAINKDGVIWYGGEGGAFRIGPENAETNLTSLPRGRVYSIAAGPDGSFWFATDEGLFRHDGKVWTHWTKDDGLLSDSITDIAVASDGSVWMTSSSGISVYKGDV